LVERERVSLRQTASNQQPHGDPFQRLWRLIPGEQLGQITGRLHDPGWYNIHTLYITPEQVLWAAGGFGAVAYTHGRWTNERPIPFPRFTWFRNTLWHSSDEPIVFRCDGDRWRSITVPFHQCRDLYADPLGLLIAGSLEGLWYSEDGSRWQQFSALPGDLYVRRLWGTLPGVLWFTTASRTEIYRYDWQRERLTTLALPGKRLPAWSRGATSALPDPQGGLWVCRDSSGLWHWDGEEWTQARVVDYEGRRRVFGGVNDLCFDSQQRLWAAHFGGLFLYEADYWHPLVVVQETPQGPQVIGQGLQGANRLYLDGNGRMWAGTGWGGLFWADATQQPYLRPSSVIKEATSLQTICLHTL